MPSTHRLASKAKLTVSQIAREPFIAVRPGAPLRERLEAFFAASGGAVTIRGETASAVSAGQLVAQGLGLAIADPYVANVFLGDSRLMTPDERDALLTRIVYGQQPANEDRAHGLRDLNKLEIHQATANEERIKVAIEQFWRESTHPHKTRFDIVHSELAQNAAKYFGTNPPYPLSSTTSLGKIKKVIANIRRQQKVTATSTPWRRAVINI